MHINTSHAVENQAPAAAQARLAQATPPTREAEREANPNAEDSRPTKSVNPASDAARLNEADLRQVQQLKARDREVRAHEQAHLAAGGALAQGGATYTYEKGPDGKRYAVGGEVQLASAQVPGDPQATAERAEQVQRAATAPASPSAQDRAVAAQAAALATQARGEARAEARAESRAETTVESNTEATQAVNDVGTPEALSQESPQAAESQADTESASASSEIALYESIAAIEEEASSGFEDFQTVTV